MPGPIPFEVPAKFAASVASGDLVRIGALLKDSGTGRIVAHLQETGAAQHLFNGMQLGPLSFFQPLETFATQYQLAGIKSAIESLQVLQFANLGLAIAGIGINIAGFAMMKRKLEGIQSKLDGLGRLIEFEFLKQRQERVRVLMAQVESLLERAEQAHHLTNPAKEWLQIAGDLAKCSTQLRSEITYLLGANELELSLFITFVRAYLACDASRLECLVLSNELRAAKQVAADNCKHYRAVFDPLSPFTLVAQSSHLQRSSNVTERKQLEQKAPEMIGIVQGLRDITDIAATKPALLETLIDQEINGRAYIEHLRSETETPYLLLSA